MNFPVFKDRSSANASVNLPMSWAPDETHAQLNAEAPWLYGAIFAGVSYGVILVLFSICSYTLWGRIRTRSTRTRSSVYLFIYASISFSLVTTMFSLNTRITQLGFINNRGFPGGPAAYEEAIFFIPLNVASSVSYVLASWWTDLLMLWRCTVIYQDCKALTKVATVGLSCLVFLASVVLGVLWLVQISSPSSSPYQNTAMGINFTVPFFSVGLAVTITVTIMIVGRLLYYRHHVTRVFGPRMSLYTSLTAILVESASLYSASSLFFIIPFAMGSSFENAPLQIIQETEVVASFLIICRVLQGKGWSNEVIAEITSGRCSGAPVQSPHGVSVPSGMRFGQGPKETQVNTSVLYRIYVLDGCEGS
ncbi:hypothetical protein BV22DRAFT_318901 [Leucogyrophana mollusca]|uniref:Uncharacterized protein n=1 Tax=Leucogyrophana mollusca TaxID=85980 RepID=A0ACB8BMC3_9AGAM|nr:hypothetical protein BV22DRAFT_318901 [Leucogyrophana mollusca]